jgi:SAM-dependent methyltransferase
MSGMSIANRIGDLRTEYAAYASIAGDVWRDMRRRLPGSERRDAGPFRGLEIGCGAFYPYVALFNSAGVNVVGIDVTPLVRRDFRVSKYRELIRSRGLVPALRRMAGDLSFHVIFYRPLGKAAQVPVEHRGAQLVRMDAARCGFGDGTFDFVYSSACFEHLADVHGTLAEMERVLKPNGVAHIEIHLFTSMTGGHEPPLYGHRVPPEGFQLWGHLLDPRWNAPLFLNRWREHEFRDAFANRFDIVDRKVTSDHGRQYLTDEIAAKLSPEYSRDELATESVLYVLRRR